MAHSGLATHIITLMEAMYAVELPRDQWLCNVLNTAAPFLDKGSGIGGLLYQLDTDGGLNVDYVNGANMQPEWLKVGSSMHDIPELIPHIRSGYLQMQCCTMEEWTRNISFATHPLDIYKRFGLAGSVMINGIDTSNAGCALYIFMTADDRLSERRRELLSRLASHMATAYRLQRKVTTATSSSIDSVAAVISVNGDIEHTTGIADSDESRKQLSDAFAARLWARGKARHDDTERATKVWTALVNGNWSLVDHFEKDGKKYVLARENALTSTGPTSLTRREHEVVALAALGRVNKLIAYELGIAAPTVRVIMARAAKKMGVESRSALIDKYRRLAEQNQNH